MTIQPYPRFLSTEDEERTYRACGQLALRWGSIELLIEHMIIILRFRQRPAEGPFPASFSRKISELKNRLKADGLTDVADALRPHLTKAKTLHRIRTNIVHSLFQGQRFDGRLILGRSDHKRGVAYTEDGSNYLIEDIEQAANDIVELHDDLEPIARSFRIE